MLRQVATWGTTLRRHGLATLSLCVVMALMAGCKNSAPNDIFVDEQTTEAIVFVKTYGEETLNRSWSSGNLYKLSPISPDGRVTPITEYEGASVSDPVVSFDGTKIMFSMRPPGQSSRNIYEINTDGTGLTQVTDNGGHDFDPVYLPDGRVLFTSSRGNEMDEYNHSRAEHMHVCNEDGTGVERLSFNQSDDFDPVLLPSGRIAYTRWDHFGTFNRFPLFATNPDGTGIFHFYGPHNRNFFHAQPTPDGRMIAIESTMVNEDAGPIAVLKLEGGPADPAPNRDIHWDVLNANVNGSGAPWPYGAFKYPFPIGDNSYVASYTLPAADEGQVDYGLYTFSLTEEGSGTEADPTRISINDLTFLYNDPNTNEYDAQLIAPREKPPVIEPVTDPSVDWGIFTAQDVFNRGNDGQERPQKGIDPITEIAVYAARPTRPGEMNDFSANEFEKRALIGFAPVQSDGSFSIRVPADTPIGFATLDQNRRGFVTKRTWISVRPGETFDKCTGCHEDRGQAEGAATNPNPMAATMEPTDLNIPRDQFTIINYRDDVQAVVQAKCQSCHSPGFVPDIDIADLPRDPRNGDPITAAGGLDLSDTPETTMMENQTFPRGYINLSGEAEMMDHQVTRPAFPRRSLLVDYVMGLGDRDGMGSHPTGDNALTAEEIEMFNLWVLLGAQYR